MKRSEIIKLMIEAYCDSKVPQTVDNHERKMNRILDKLEKEGMKPERYYWFPETVQEVKDIFNDNKYPPQNLCSYIMDLDKNHPDFKELFDALDKAVSNTSPMWCQSKPTLLNFLLTNHRKDND